MTGVVAIISNSVAYVATATPPVAAGVGPGIVVFTDPVSVTMNVAGAFSYSWSYVSGTVSINVTSPTSATTSWSVNGMEVGEIRSATWRCTVIFNGKPVASVDVPVTVTRI